MIEDIFGIHDAAAAEGVLPMIKASAHNDDVLFGRIGMLKDLAEIIQISRITHGDQDVAWSNPHRTAAQLLVSVNPKLVQLLGSAVALAPHPVLGIREDSEECSAECDAGDGCFILGKKVNDGSREKNDGNDGQPDWDLFPGNVKISWNFPLSIAWFGVAQHQHGERFHGEAPDHAKGIK